MANYDKKEYHLLDYISVKADRIIRQTKCYKIGDEYISSMKKSKTIVGHNMSNVGPELKIERKFHNFIISKNSQKNIREKISWLYRFAKGRTIRTYSGKEIYNFKCSFITLTIPSVQKHPTGQIMKECFEPLLTLLRNHLGMLNYVWKLEFQKNGNMHIHLLTDTYIDFFYIRSKWNEKLKTLGYIDDYQSKMSKMTLYEYLNNYSDGSPESTKKCRS